MLLCVSPSSSIRLVECMDAILHTPIKISMATSEMVDSAIQVAASGKQLILGTSFKLGATVITRTALLLHASIITNIMQILDSHMYACPLYTGNVLCHKQAKILMILN